MLRLWCSDAAVCSGRPFFLYLSFRDPHRCEAGGKYGDFCERLGNGQPGFGLIPDWKPVHYDPNNITVPYFLPNSATTRRELANMYTAVSRLDQGQHSTARLTHTLTELSTARFTHPLTHSHSH